MPRKRATKAQEELPVAPTAPKKQKGRRTPEEKIAQENARRVKEEAKQAHDELAAKEKQQKKEERAMIYPMSKKREHDKAERQKAAQEAKAAKKEQAAREVEAVRSTAQDRVAALEMEAARADLERRSSRITSIEDTQPRLLKRSYAVADLHEHAATSASPSLEDVPDETGIPFKHIRARILDPSSDAGDVVNALSRGKHEHTFMLQAPSDSESKDEMSSQLSELEEEEQEVTTELDDEEVPAQLSGEEVDQLASDVQSKHSLSPATASSQTRTQKKKGKAKAEHKPSFCGGVDQRRSFFTQDESLTVHGHGVSITQSQGERASRASQARTAIGKHSTPIRSGNASTKYDRLQDRLADAWGGVSNNSPLVTSRIHRPLPVPELGRHWGIGSTHTFGRPPSSISRIHENSESESETNANTDENNIMQLTDTEVEERQAALVSPQKMPAARAANKKLMVIGAASKLPTAVGGPDKMNDSLLITPIPPKPRKRTTAMMAAAVVDGKKPKGPRAQAAKSVGIKEEPIDLTISVPPKVSGEVIDIGDSGDSEESDSEGDTRKGSGLAAWFHGDHDSLDGDAAQAVHGEFLITKNTVIYERARQKLYDWRNGIGQAAVQAVDAHFNAHPQKYNSLDARQKWAAYMLENYRFAYWDTADPDADEWSGVLCSSLMEKTLAYHYSWFKHGKDVLIPQLLNGDGEEKVPVGAIGLATSALERILTKWSMRHAAISKKNGKTIILAAPKNEKSDNKGKMKQGTGVHFTADEYSEMTRAWSNCADHCDAKQFQQLLSSAMHTAGASTRWLSLFKTYESDEDPRAQLGGHSRRDGARR
ncbi:hypothetical protein NEOLEDRAFT_1183090 [Neolentinus lepideus HHB14362 ss-1]|uniref:Uncharacterized protein n=1 Tax=Neolentinus lepideus HHB14362 ss-1 TaxID=1314782 RepID=A0A165NKN1_9AGAM|nr:hypothetical protein NEOLEDRAFT_1183090 [Neolentinus lepideus HHB14362 ss-1]